MSMTEKKHTKIDFVKQHLLKHGSITQLQSWELYHYSRLSDCIWKLRHKEGWEIDSEDIQITDCNHNPCTYAKYIFRSNPETSALNKPSFETELQTRPTGDKVEHKYVQKEQPTTSKEVIFIQQDLF